MAPAASSPRTTVLRFAGFEFDEARRELRLRGRELPLQPRVFDLIAYLIARRDRVVGKEELLNALWPGTVVVDGALQRVISLARAALQQGDARHLIRTYARRGYRFCAEVGLDEEATPRDDRQGALAEAHDAFHRMDWEHAMAAYREADTSAALSGADLERWAQAAQWSGQATAAIEPLERAVTAHLSVADRAGAARAALLLSQIALERRVAAVATGWHGRAARFLAGAGRCRELGLHHCLAARLALFEGDLEGALADAQAARQLAVDLEDPDLEGLGLLYAGHALLGLGRVTEGARLQNEAAAAVLSGEVGPWAGALIYCGVIYACRNRADWSQAAQWTEQFSRWCERQRLAAFPGTCRLHRAEVLGMCGELEEAEREVAASTALLSSWAPWAEGEAYRVLGELRVDRGDFQGAAEAFARARELGWDPQPGYSRLLMARGRHEEAATALEHSLMDRSWVNQERRGLLLAHLTLACARAGRIDQARGAVLELSGKPELWSTPALEATVLEGKGEIARRDSRPDEAVRSMRQAAQLWRGVGSPLKEAEVRLRLAQWLAQWGEAASARVELDHAEPIFLRHGAATRWLDRCRQLRAGMTDGSGEAIDAAGSGNSTGTAPRDA